MGLVSRLICYVLAAALSLTVIAVAMVEFLFRSQVKPQLEKNRATQERYYQAYADDQAFLARIGFFKTARAGQNDAGPHLNPKLYWHPLKTRNNSTAAQPIVPISVREELLRLRSDFMRKFARAKNMKADLSIFNGLAHFDHWDLEVASPISDLSTARAFVPPPQLPVPEVSDLLAAVKLRLMLGALNGDFVASLTDVRQLAKLMLTTENMQLVLGGVSVLETERIGYRYFVEDRGLAPNAWAPIDGNVLRRAYRAITATRAYLRLWTPAEKIEKTFLKEKLPIGFCAAVNDAFPLELTLRPTLEPHWPMEIRLNAEYRRLDQVFERARASCRLRYLSDLVDKRRIWTRIPGPLVLNRLPYSRKVFALRASAVNFGGLEGYSSAQ